MKSFHEKSYEQHTTNFSQYRSGGEKEKHAKTWFEKDTVDAWRHQRMYQTLDPILKTEPNAKWLTVGDGRYGSDAKYIMEKGCDALASDISDVLIKEAADIGYISKFEKQNAESLSFADSEFDYVFCKESYHHFPRPMLALYEMLRVAKRGVFLIEPNDAYLCDGFLEYFFRNIIGLAKRFLGRGPHRKHFFEDVGNYVFSISKREIEKVALGLNYKTVAFKGINDAYFFGVEYEKLLANGPLQKKVRTLINIANCLCKIGMRYGLLAAIIFKKEPSEELCQALVGGKFEVIHLPDNPYISA